MDIYAQLTPIFRDVFDRDDITASAEMTAAEVEEWDSLSHIRLVVAIESVFGIRFGVGELSKLKNVGEMAAAITAKRA